MTNIVIRKMCKTNLEVVSELAMLANPHAVKERYRKFILDELKKNPDLSIVAVDKERVVGYALADVRNEISILEDMAVAVEYQAKGIGNQLLNTILDVLKHKGIKIVFAEVHYKCASAIPFYYKHNFRISGFNQDYFGIGHDAILLKLVLQ